MLTRGKTIAAGCCLFISSFAYPLAAVSGDEVTRLGTVTVTGEIAPEGDSYQLEMDEVPGIAPDAASLLHKVPGANVNRNGALTGIVQYRGLFGDRVNVSVDGMTVQEACPNGMDTPLSFLPGTRLESIEVIRGIAPVSSGLETLGGTVRATAIRPAFGTGDELESHGSLHLSGATVNDAGAVGLMVGLGSATHRVYVGGSREVGDDIEFHGGTLRPSGYERNSYSAGYGYRRTGHEAALDYSRVETGMTGTPSLPMDIEFSDTDMVSSEYTGYLGAHAVHGQLYFTDVSHRMTNYLLRPDPGVGNRRRNTAGGTGTGFRFDVGRDLHGGELLAGIDGQLASHDAVINDPDNAMFRVVNFNDAQRNLLGVFTEWDGPLGRRWHGEFGLRVNQVHMDADPVSHHMAGANANIATLQNSFNSADRSRTDTNVDWVARFTHPLSGIAGVEIGVARKTRAPSYQERYLWIPLEATGGLADGRTYIGDLYLDPEVSHQIELALDLETAAAYLEPRLFYRDVSDYIQGVPSTNPAATGIDPNALQFANVDAALYGADAAWGYRFDEHWRLDGIVSYVRGKRDDITDNLYRIAPLNGTVGLGYEAAAWNITAEVVFYDRQDKVSATNGETRTGGYALMNLYGRYRMKQGLTVSGGIGNVFDRRYAAHVTGINRAAGSDVAVGQRVPGEGRNLHIALQLDW